MESPTGPRVWSVVQREELELEARSSGAYHYDSLCGLGKQGLGSLTSLGLLPTSRRAEGDQVVSQVST